MNNGNQQSVISSLQMRTDHNHGIVWNFDYRNYYYYHSKAQYIQYTLWKLWRVGGIFHHHNMNSKLKENSWKSQLIMKKVIFIVYIEYLLSNNYYLCIGWQFTILLACLEFRVKRSFPLLVFFSLIHAVHAIHYPWGN